MITSSLENPKLISSLISVSLNDWLELGLLLSEKR